MDENCQIKAESHKNHKLEYYDDEIELMDYLLVLWNWKYLILIGTTVCGLIGVVIGVSLPKIYRIDMLLQSGIAHINNNGDKIYIDSPQSIINIIETNVLDKTIEKYLRLSGNINITETPKFKASKAKGSDIIKVSYETDNIDIGIEILNALTKALQEISKDTVRKYQENYENEIILKKIELSSLEEELGFIKQMVKLSKDRIEKLTIFLNNLDKSSYKLLNHKDNTILLLANQYKNSIEEYLYRIKLNNIQEIKQKYQKKQLTEEIKTLELNKSSINNIILLQPPTASAQPVKPKKKQIIILAFIVGFILMLFLTFFIRSIKNENL